MSEQLNRRSFIQKAGVCAGSLALLPGASSASGVASSVRAKTDGLVAFRISTGQWLADDRFQALLDFFRKAPGTADEVAFFTSMTHPPLPLPEMLRRSERLGKLLPLIRQEGMSAGINILSTMGHHEENLEGSLQEPWQRVVDTAGGGSKGSFCPAGAELLDYVQKVYTALANASPDFIWIDDDVRLLGHMPVGFTCFCETCLRGFSTQMKRTFTRESLLSTFSSGSFEERLEARRAWLNHNRATINHLFEVIEQTVHKVKPGLPLGFMTGDRFYEGYDFANWARTLAGPNHSEVRWRPGGGFYSDITLEGLVEKAHDIGRQVSQLPAEVKIIQSEIENFPYDLLRKSAETTVIEAAAHMAAGTTGTAFNVLSQRADPLEEYEPMLRRVRRAKDFYAILREELGRSPVVGLWPAWNRDLSIAGNVDGGWPNSDAPGDLRGKGYVLGEIGVPLCYGQKGAVATILSGPSVFAFSREELRQIFSGGVLMDVSAWRSVDRLGLADWTGVQPGRKHERDASEVLTNHPINGRFAGWSRDCRQSFWREEAYNLDPRSPKVATLARLTNYQDHDLGPTMTAFENELGGRVCVMGYYPWAQMHHLAKSSQMKAVSQWLSRDRLPVALESFARVHLWVRQPAPDSIACVLLNGSLDPQPSVTLRFRGPFKKFTWSDFDGKSSTLKPTRSPGTGGVEVKTPALKAWSISLITAKP